MCVSVPSERDLQCGCCCRVWTATAVLTGVGLVLQDSYISDHASDMEQSELLIEPSNIEQSELCGLWTRVVCELTRIFVNLLW